MTTRTKMHTTNSQVRHYLAEQGFKNLYMFPHLRFSKDYLIDSVPFDAICTLGNNICLIQIKTHCRASKQLLGVIYPALEAKYGIKCLWVNKEKKTRTSKKGEIKIYGNY